MFRQILCWNKNCSTHLLIEMQCQEKIQVYQNTMFQVMMDCHIWPLTFQSIFLSFCVSTKFGLDDCRNICMEFVIKSTSVKMHSVATVIALIKSSCRPRTTGSRLR